MPGKLNRLQRLLPEGLIVDAAWLERHGYSSALRSQYAAAGWLQQVTRGVYRRPPAGIGAEDYEAKLRWQHVVISLQTLLDQPIIVGGRTALELQGFAHYLPSSSGPWDIHLYGDAAPPGWLAKLPLNDRFIFHNARRLFRAEPIGDAVRAIPQLGLEESVTGDHPTAAGLTWEPWGSWNWRIVLSSPERAILELLDELPGHETFHQADMLMEGLRTLSPRRLDTLLADCRSVKVKRLFFWLAERHGHAWLGRIDRTRVDLGSGKRMIVRGGRFDTKYQITVPENLDAGG